METLSTNGMAPAPVQEPQTVREYLQERASNFEESRNKALKGLETLPKALLDLRCDDLAKIGIYI